MKAIRHGDWIDGKGRVIDMHHLPRKRAVVYVCMDGAVLNYHRVPLG